MLVLMLPRISSRVSGFPVASPCLWGKLQNLSLSKVSKQVVMSLCVAGAALQTSLAKCHACHGICTLSPLDAALPMRFAKIRGTTHLKCCACHAKWRWTGPKWRPCHENCNASFENVAKVLRLPHKTTFDTLQNTSECHEVSRLPCETKQRHMKPPKVTPFAEHLIYRHGHKALTRTVADGCELLRTVADGWATSSEHTLNPQTPRVKREPMLCIRENTSLGQIPTAPLSIHQYFTRMFRHQVAGFWGPGWESFASGGKARRSFLFVEDAAEAAFQSWVLVI